LPENEEFGGVKQKFCYLSVAFFDYLNACPRDAVTSKNLRLSLLSSTKIADFLEAEGKRRVLRRKSEFVSGWRGVLHLFKKLCYS
jgi:hypothetical protein